METQQIFQNLGRIIYVQGKIYIFEKSGPFSQIK